MLMGGLCRWQTFTRSSHWLATNLPADSPERNHTPELAIPTMLEGLMTTSGLQSRSPSRGNMTPHGKRQLQVARWKRGSCGFLIVKLLLHLRNWHLEGVEVTQSLKWDGQEAAMSSALVTRFYNWEMFFIGTLNVQIRGMLEIPPEGFYLCWVPGGFSSSSHKGTVKRSSLVSS